MQDPIIISAQAREMLQTLHKRTDTVVKFKTNRSGYAEDQLDAIDELAPGHFRADKKIMQINLDKVLGTKPIPNSLKSIEDWRKYPVLAGVCAHESAHARWSLWESDGNALPTSIPNPDYDASNPEETGPEFFPVDPRDGKLYDLAKLLEEPRVGGLAHGEVELDLFAVDVESLREVVDVLRKQRRPAVVEDRHADVATGDDLLREVPDDLAELYGEHRAADAAHHRGGLA